MSWARGVELGPFLLAVARKPTDNPPRACLALLPVRRMVEISLAVLGLEAALTADTAHATLGAGECNRPGESGQPLQAGCWGAVLLPLDCCAAARLHGALHMP